MSQSSQVFSPMSPPVTRTKDEIIAEIMEEFKNLLFLQISSILASCKPKTIYISLLNTKNTSKTAKNMASKILLQHFREKQLLNLQQHPQNMVEKLFKRFTSPSNDQIFTSKQQSQSFPHVVSNATKTIGNKLSTAAGISKVYNREKETLFEMERIQRKAANMDSMSKEEKRILFNDIQRVYLLGFIDELTAGGIEIAHMTAMRNCIANPVLSCPASNIFELIHQYIKFKYSKAASSITKSSQLLQFISLGLPFLSAIMSPYYQDEKDFLDFKIYLPLVKEYIEFILKESNINLAGDSTTVARSIIDLIRAKLCDFVKIAGYPDIVIRTITLSSINNFIIDGVTSYLYSRGDIGQGGGNRRRIKKYKNRTIRRTKHRTNRYKIKNRKTRKMRKP